MRKKPMLAYPVSAKPIDYNEPVFIQPKLDYHKDKEEYEICAEIKKEIDKVNDKLSKL